MRLPLLGLGLLASMAAARASWLDCCCLLTKKCWSGGFLWMSHAVVAFRKDFWCWYHLISFEQFITNYILGLLSLLLYLIRTKKDNEINLLFCIITFNIPYFYDIYIILIIIKYIKNNYYHNKINITIIIEELNASHKII